VSINREKLRVSAQKHLQRGAVDKAIKDYERLVEDDPKDVRTLLKLGDLQTRAGDNASATQTYMRVAQFYGDQGFFLKAVAVYKQILKIDPAILEVNIKLADLYQQLGLLSDASTQYRQLAHLFEEQDRIDECAGVLRRMLEIDPENVASRVKLAEMYARQNKLEEAKREFRESAAFLKQQDRIDDWIKVAERMVYFHPEDLGTTRELAQVYLGRGDAKRALAKLQVCFKQNARDAETLELLATAFRELDQPAKAVSVYKELARLHKEAHEPEYHAQAMAHVLELSPSDPDARQAVEAARRDGLAAPAPVAARVRAPEIGRPRAASIPPEPTRPLGETSAQETVARLLAEADVYLKYGLTQKALDQVKRIIAMAPDSREAHDHYKTLLVDSGDLPAAAAHLLERARYELGLGHKSFARDDLEELLGIDPKNAEAAALLRVLEGAAIAPLAGGVIGSAAETELELEPGEGGADDEVPTVVRSGTGPDPSIRYEPSPDAAQIDLDADEEGLLAEEDAAAEDAAPAAADDDTAETLPGIDLDADDDETPAPPTLEVVAAPIPAPRRSPPAEAPQPAPITKPAAVVRPAVERPVASRAGGIDDLDALLASAVPTRGPTGATSETVVAKAPAAETALPTDGPAFQPTPGGYVELDLEPEPVAAPEIDVEVAEPADAEPALAEAIEPEPVVGPLDISDEVEEVRFYSQQGLLEEAQEAATALARRYPDHPDVSALLLELEGTAGAPATTDETEPEPVQAETDDEEPHVESVGLAQELEGAFAAASTEDLQAELGDVFDQFKRGVAEQVDDSDHSTHYDLGIAYKEMGLLDDAIREFGIAQRATQREVVALTMIGLCRLEQGDSAAALESFQAGLSSPQATANEAVALRYEIALTYEAQGRGADALRFFEKVHAMDPGFRDAATKVQELREGGGESGEVTHELDELLADRPAAADAAAESRRKISYL
jgi:pilus assembly protein FimV